MTKVVVVGDGLVSAETLAEAALELNIEEPVEVTKYHWYADLNKEQFQEKIKLIEQKGPESVEIPTEISRSLSWWH